MKYSDVCSLLALMVLSIKKTPKDYYYFYIILTLVGMSALLEELDPPCV